MNKHKINLFKIIGGELSSNRVLDCSNRIELRNIKQTDQETISGFMQK